MAAVSAASGPAVVSSSPDKSPSAEACATTTTTAPQGQVDSSSHGPVKSSSGACGSNGSSVAHFAKQAEGMVFHPALFARWLRTLLVAFYKDEEIVVTNLLLQRSCYVRDVHLAQALRMAERQVRQACELRLVPDNIVERQVEGEMGRMKTFYRISPLCLEATSNRLQVVEDSLASDAFGKSDVYHCLKCRRTYDTLEAMATMVSASMGESSAMDAPGLAFQCEDCNEELKSIQRYRCKRCRRGTDSLILAEKKAVLDAKAAAEALIVVPETASLVAGRARYYQKQEPVVVAAPRLTACQCGGEFEIESADAHLQAGMNKLSRFREQCRDLLLLTRQLKGMPIPQFQKEEKTRSKFKGRDAYDYGFWAQAAAPNVSGIRRDPRGGMFQASTGPAKDGEEADEGPATLMDGSISSVAPVPGTAEEIAEAEAAAKIADKASAKAEWFQREVLGGERLHAQTDIGTPTRRPEAAAFTDAELEASMREDEERSSDRDGWALERLAKMRRENEVMKEPDLLIQGEKYPLSRVREDYDLQDRMDDAELQKFVDLDREHERSFGFLG